MKIVASTILFQPIAPLQLQNLWGERYDDRADLTSELLVGRLPFSDSSEAADYVAKLIGYETDPGGEDYSWLNRAFFYSSDQMRDYRDVGQ